MTEKPVLSDADKVTVVQRYVQRFAEHGATIESLNVGDISKYRRQHEVHLELMPAATSSVTDIGCGLALFYDSLKRAARNVSYTGIDIVPGFIESNRVTHPEASFQTRDIFTEGLPGPTDHVVMCQVFNNKFRDSDNLLVIQQALAVAFAAARQSVSVDMLSTHVNYREPHLFYFDPCDLFQYAKTLTPYVILRHDYARHHFTLGLYRECTSACV